MWIVGFLVYSLICTLSYKNVPNNLINPYILVGVLGAIGNIAWLRVAKTATDDSNILLKGVYWDTMITLIYLAIPLIAFGVKLTSVSQILGAFLIIAGLLLIKIGYIC